MIDCGRKLINLRCHPADVKAYGELKAHLAAEHPYDIEAYCDGKDAFVQELEQKALAFCRGQR